MPAPARTGLALAGMLCVTAAAILDVEFVRTRVAWDGVVTPEQAAALPAARLALATFGGLLLAAAAFLERILAARWLTSLRRSRRRMTWAVFLAPVAILLTLAGYKLARGPGDPLYLLAVREDSLVEATTALAFLGGCIVASMIVTTMYGARRYFLSVYYAGIWAFCLFVALEEVSYGQRLLGFATPESVAASNLQNEMTIHNLAAVKALFFKLGPLALGLFGMLDLVRLALRRWIDPRRAEVASFMVPPWFLASWFVPLALFALYVIFFWRSTAFVEWQDQELLEALLALGFFGFLWYNLSRLRRGHVVLGTTPTAAEVRC
jgi:hypothetical protein